MDLYHKGERLFYFDRNGLKTHLKYASVISTSVKDCLTGSDLADYKIASKAKDYRFYRGRKGGINFSR